MDNKNNTCDCNAGYRNTGHYNTGHYNTGGRNTGNGNSASWNTGNCNTDNNNTGHYNTGRRNTGNNNTGNYNTGNYNTGNYNAGDCNTTTPTVRLFNRDSGLPFGGEVHRKFSATIAKFIAPFTEWIDADVMTDEEKRYNPSYLTTGGFLKINKCMRNNEPLTPKDREFLVGLPNFDASILKECTGIDVDEEKVKLTIGDKSIWISRESADAMKAQL